MGYNITVKDIINVTKGNLLYGNENEVCENFSRNTKEINKDDVYIGFKGEHCDGAEFYEEALLKGAKGCIINKNVDVKVKPFENKFIIEVEDTVEAIGEIAKFKRSKYNIPVIAITGSVGKTSTKDIIYSVVSEKYKTLKTQGNMNNHIGMPMTILKLKEHEALVLEMGMDHTGEISKLTNIAKPDIAVITNVGTSHIGTLGSIENILKAKLEILEGLNKKGTLIINNDDDLLHKWQLKNNEYKVIRYGIDSESENIAKNIAYNENSSSYTLYPDDVVVTVPICGEAFIYNSLAAVSVGKLLDIPMQKIINGIKKFELTKMRVEIQRSSKGYTIINASYNANLDSMKSSIQQLKLMTGDRKIAVLGDMLNLGEFSKELHEKVGEEVAKNNVDILITVGKESKYIASEARGKGIKDVFEFEDKTEAIAKLKSILKANDVILIKASNGMKFSEIVNELL